MRFSAAARAQPQSLMLPMPDGTLQQFEIVNAPVMHPDLQAKYPGLRSFAGKGIDDPTAYLRFSLTTKGFNAMVISAKYSTVFIDPYTGGNTEYYVSYYKKDYAPQRAVPFSCGVAAPEDGSIKRDNPESADGNAGNLSSPRLAGDCQLRTYRLALACTGEYANFHGGTVGSVMAEYVVAMTRVNGIYEKDLTVTMELIPDTDELIYLNAATDPYTNGSGGTMLGENQANCDNVIGPANYDIGHVFSTGGGGIASLAVPCTSNKARGVTGLPSPVNDPFYVEYVAHEMGHQFGANHTQNNSCGRNSATAVEPGSASTVMGYAGICAPNVQNNGDDYFHAISIQEITNNIENGNSSGCPVAANTGNTAPTAAVAAAFYNLPVSTPFALTCIATDPDGDALTYTWEQMDNEVATMPPVPTNTGGPAFRSNIPSESPTRYFPNLNAINNNTTPAWEVLPSVSRDMSFRCTVRDNFPLGGCRDEVDVDLSFHASAGPFLVLSPNTNLTWVIAETETVSWDVANTDAAPVSCSDVDILLSTDGGLTYPVTLASGVPNTGSFDITVPNAPTNSARVKVVCSDNIFFDVSNQNFAIELPPTPTFLMQVTPFSQSICNSEELVYTIDLTSILGFDEAVALSVTGLPDGATAAFDNNPVTPTGTVQLTIGNLSDVPSGTYSLTINAASNSLNATSGIEMVLTGAIPEITALNAPVDGATGVELSATLEWEAQAPASSYFIEIATSPVFGNTVIESFTESGNAYSPQNLEERTIYYWRVKGINICGEGDFSTVFAFQTTQSACTTYESSDVPVPISTGGGNLVTSIINVGDEFVLEKVKASLFIQHTWVGDLIARLSAPSGTTVELFNRPGVPGSNFGCGENNISATFDDEAPNSASDFENTCGPGTPAISGDFQPAGALAGLNGGNSAGTWTLTVTDNVVDDGGAIASWSLELCSAVVLPEAPALLANTILTLPQGSAEVVTNAYLEANSPANTADQIVYTITSVPANGTLYLEILGTFAALSTGGQFTQADINNNLLSYTHDGSSTTSDSFDFDVVNNENGWLHGSTFQINILENILSATAGLDIDIDCFGANNGQASVTVIDGYPPFEYSLDGINYQPENIFSGLAPGSYTFTVRDVYGFTILTNEVVIANPDELAVSAAVAGDEITVTAGGGTGSLMYSIDGVNYQSSNVFSGLANGVYPIYVTDENGCVAETEATVRVNTLAVTAALTIDLACYNGMDAAIEVSVGGGTPDFTYSLNGGPFQSSPVFDGLGAGSYVITVMDSDGFTAETGEITISNPPELTISAAVDQNDITVNAAGGTGSLMYSIDGANYQSGNVFAGLDNGFYTVYATDENGCVAETEAVVAVNTLIAMATLVNELACYNDTDAVIEASVGGGTPGFTYSLNGGPFQSSPVFGGLGAGSYVITVMDSDGFTAETGEITISNPPELTASATVDQNDITVNADGGTGSLVYSVDGLNFQSSAVFTGLANGVYTVYVIDENGCVAETEATIFINTLVVTATLANGLACHNDTNAAIEVSVGGGTPGFTYSLNGGPFQSSPVFNGLGAGSYIITVMDSDGFTADTGEITISNPPELTVSADVAQDNIIISANGGTGELAYSINGVSYQSSNVFTNLSNGVYTVHVRDENGCVAKTEATVLVNTLVVTATLTNDLNCNDDTDASIEVSVGGGTPDFMYSLNGGPFQSSPVFDGLGAGSYVITVMDSDGFTADAEEIIIENPEAITGFSAVIGYDITVTAGGGTGNLQYSLNGGPFQSGNVFAGNPNGVYTITVMDENGCRIEISATVDVEALSIATTHQGLSCHDADDGLITVDVTGGVPPYQYSIDGINFQDEMSFSGLSGEDYVVTAIDAGGFAVTSGTISISNPDPLVLEAIDDENDVTLNAGGGTAPYLYSIDGMDYSAENTFLNLENGVYTFYVQDANGCETTDTVAINILGVGGLDFDLALNVHPNPGNGDFNVSIQQKTASELSFKVFDVTGKLIYAEVHQAAGPAFSKTLHLMHLPGGMYHLVVSNEQQAGVKKLVVLK
ncbi:MAG: proprotein convertase P-domain-containing protein [Phaeodactylibacter sp.]|nr:proprotein convertase P-domain-containing protein [Phaeodactylibacter sp.]